MYDTGLGQTEPPKSHYFVGRYENLKFLGPKGYFFSGRRPTSVKLLLFFLSAPKTYSAYRKTHQDGHSLAWQELLLLQSSFKLQEFQAQNTLFIFFGTVQALNKKKGRNGFCGPPNLEVSVLRVRTANQKISVCPPLILHVHNPVVAIISRITWAGTTGWVTPSVAAICPSGGTIHISMFYCIMTPPPITNKLLPHRPFHFLLHIVFDRKNFVYK